MSSPVESQTCVLETWLERRAGPADMFERADQGKMPTSTIPVAVRASASEHGSGVSSDIAIIMIKL